MMLFRGNKPVFFFAMLLLLQPVRAEVDQGEALEMLARMIQAKKTLDYQGTLVIYPMPSWTR